MILFCFISMLKWFLYYRNNNMLSMALYFLYKKLELVLKGFLKYPDLKYVACPVFASETYTQVCMRDFCSPLYFNYRFGCCSVISHVTFSHSSIGPATDLQQPKIALTVCLKHVYSTVCNFPALCDLNNGGETTLNFKNGS